MGYQPSGGGGGAGSGLPKPYKWVLNQTTGKLELTKDADTVMALDENGAEIAHSVTTGVGSFHLGDVHSIGSANENVVFVNDITNVAWFPAWQGISKDGSTVTEPSVQVFGALTNTEPSGAVGTGNIDYVDNITAATDITYFKLEIVPHENYKGVLVWTAIRTPSNKEVASFAVNVDLVAGDRFALNFEYPLFVKSGQTFTVSLKKGYDGAYLRVRNGASLPATPYRRVFTRTTQNSPLMPQAGDTKQSFSTADHNGWFLLNGRAKSTLTTAQQTVATNLGFGANLPNAQDRILIGAGSTYSLRATGGSATIARSALPNFTLTGNVDDKSIAHTHGGSSLTVSTTNTDHTHGKGTLEADYGNANHSHGAGSYALSQSGNHTHGASANRMVTVGMDSGSSYNGCVGFSSYTSDGAGDHTHTISGQSTIVSASHGHTISGSTGAAATNASHSHTISGDTGAMSANSAHNHSYTTSSINGNVPQTAHLPPYLALNTFIYLGL